MIFIRPQCVEWQRVDINALQNIKGILLCYLALFIHMRGIAFRALTAGEHCSGRDLDSGSAWGIKNYMQRNLGGAREHPAQ